MDPESIIQLVILFVLLILSAFFSSAETAFSKVNRIRMQTIAEDGNKKAKLVCKILDKYSRMLSTILIGNNVVNLAASALTTVLATNLFGSWAIGLATGALTILVLLFGEIVPKTWAGIKSESLCLFYAPIINLLCIICTPLVYIVDGLSIGILKLLRIDPNEKTSITENELLSYVDAGHEDGVIEPEEKEIIHNVFEFSDAQAKDIMIPRIDMVEVSIDASYDDVIAIFKEHMYTRLPVYENTPDNIIGVINIKDFLVLGTTTDNKEELKNNFSIRDIMRDAYYTYEFRNTSDLLNEMRLKSEAITIVLNEYGVAEGMITMEDLIEEIIGEIHDEYDEDEEKEAIKKIGDRDYIIVGSTKLDDINDRLGINLESENYDSIGGIVIEHLDDTLPKAGDVVTLEDGTVLRVLQFVDNRIKTVKMSIPEEKEDEQSEDLNT